MKQSSKRGKKNKVGAWGEEIARNYLRQRNFEIVATNYLKKWGEIDIVARRTSHETTITHFVEVKTVSYETKNDLQTAIATKAWRPEENVHAHKLTRLQRAIESWIMENNYPGEWQIDVVAIRLVPREKFATIKYLDNIIV